MRTSRADLESVSGPAWVIGQGRRPSDRIWYRLASPLPALGGDRFLGRPERHRRVELPRTELCLDVGPIPTFSDQVDRQSPRSASHLVGIAESLIGQPAPMAVLERYR
jgi:hypothetical protein